MMKINSLKPQLWMLLLLGGLLPVSLARAQERPATDKVLSLQESLRYALEQSEQLKKARYDEQIGEQKIKEVRGSGLPQLSGSGSFDYYPSLPTQILPGAMFGADGDIPVQFGKDFNVSGGVQLTQLLFNKSFFVGLEAAKSTQDLYRLRREMAEEEVIYNVSSSYLQVLQTQEQFKTIDANLERLIQLEKIMQLQYENDLVKKVDINRLKVNRTNLQNQQQNLETAYEQQKNYLKFFMGMPLEGDFMLDPDTEILDLGNPLSRGTDAAVSRLEHQLLNKQKELNNYQISNIRAGYYPSLSAYGNYSYMTMRNDLFDNQVPWFLTSVVGLKLNVPIFDGFQKKAQVRQVKLEINKIDEDIALYNKNTAVVMANATRQVQNSLNAIEAQKGNVELACDVYNTTNELYTEGISPLTDLLEAEVSLREAETNLNNEILKYKLARLSYLQAGGEIKNLLK